MENIAHTLAGLALSRTGLGKTTRFAAAALVVGSNLPDIDGVILLRGRLAYVDGHRGLTHSLVGGLALGFALGLLLCALSSPKFLRAWRKLRTRMRPLRPAASAAAHPDPPRRRRAVHYGLLMGLSVAAVLGHLGFDLLNDYGIRLLLPFSNRWIYGDTIFVVDPWFWLVLGAGLHLAIPRTFVREALAWSGWGVLSVPVLMHPVVETPARIVWVVALAILAIVRAKVVWRTGDPRPSRAALATLGVYVLLMVLLHAGAVRRARDEADRSTGDVRWEHLSALARPGDPFHWTVLYEKQADIVVTSVSSLPRASARRSAPRLYRRNLDRPEVQFALATPAGRTAQRFCRYLFADVDDHAPEVATVALRDARFAIRGRDEFSIFTVSVPRAGMGPPARMPLPPAHVDSPLLSAPTGSKEPRAAPP